jgi:DNA-binding PucR family transcriptional regulator
MLRVEQIQDVLGRDLTQLRIRDGAGQCLVRCVSVLDDLLEAHGCQGGELVLVAPGGSAASHLSELVRTLIDRRAAGLLVPSAAIDTETWRVVVGQLREHDMAAGLLGAQVNLRVAANSLNRALSTLRADTALTRLHTADTLQTLAETLAHLVGNAVTVETAKHELLAFTPTRADVDPVRRATILHRHGLPHILAWLEGDGWMTRIRRSDRPVKVAANPAFDFSGRVAMRIAGEDEMLGVIWVTDTARALGERDYEVIQQAADVAAAILSRQRAAQQQETGLRAEFLEDVVRGRITSPDSLRALARGLGWNIDRLQQALVVSIDDFERFAVQAAGRAGSGTQRVRNRLAEVVRLEALAIDPDAIIGPRSTGIVVLLDTGHADGERRKEAAIRLAERIVKRAAVLIADMTVTVGVGRDFPSFEHMTESFRQAELAATLGASLWGGNRAVHYDDLGVHRVLFALREDEEMTTPALRRLVEHDQRRGTSYVQTLATYFACMGRLSAAAEQLGIHRNTLEYRMGRIEELAGVSIDDPNNRLALELGIRLHQLQQSTAAG